MPQGPFIEEARFLWVMSIGAHGPTQQTLDFIVRLRGIYQTLSLHMGGPIYVLIAHTYFIIAM